MENKDEEVMNDVLEDQREESESVADIKEEGQEKVVNDIKEDEREETESLEDLKSALSNALVENAVLKEENVRLQRERDEANSRFLSSEKESEESNKRDLNSILGDLR